MKPIESMAGLREAVLDVIFDETTGKFTMKWLAKRLPYGNRTRVAICKLVSQGKINRVGYGLYEVRQ